MTYTKYFKKLTIILLFLHLSCLLFANKTPVKNLHEYKLENGLTLFVYENHNVPLSYIEIAVKAGASYQTPETAGLFHLYEHMMFKGNQKYPSAALFNKELSNLGVSSWNGGTSWDYVDYYFTVPSKLTREGLEFWSYAIRTPNIDVSELENEKKVVLSEITADENNPSAIGSNYLLMNLFPQQPYRADAGGSPTVVQNATVEQLRQMQELFYIPKNTALFVGGDVNPDEIFSMVKDIYGGWENSKTKPVKMAQQDTNPIKTKKIAVNSNTQVSKDITIVEFSWRGPDTEYNLNDTYIADYILDLLNDPEGILVKTLTSNKNLSIPNSEYISSGYYTTKTNGIYSIEIALLNDGKDIYEEVNLIQNLLNTKVFPQIAKDKNLYSDKKKKEIVSNLEYNDLYLQQKSSALLSSVKSSWVVANSDYYYNYNDSIGQVSQSDAEYFVKNYLSKEPLVVINMNPSELENSSISEKINSGKIELISKENSTWWNNSYSVVKGNETPNSFIKKSSSKKVEIEDGLTQEKTEKPQIETLTLNNGIKVFAMKSDSIPFVSMEIGFKDGNKPLNTKIPGLEESLFQLMSSSSKKYPYLKKNILAYKNNTDFGYKTSLYGSFLYLTTLDEKFPEMMNVLVDSVLNPDFNKDSYFDIMKSLQQQLTRIETVPTSALSYNINQEIYKNHPLKNSFGATPNSFEEITIANMMELYKEILSTNEIFVVCVGNFDCDKLISDLNKTIGKIKYNPTVSLENVTFEQLSFDEEKELTFEMKEAKGTGFLARVFPVPDYSDDEITSCLIAAKIYSDVMFNIVREHYGACYTPYSSVRSSVSAVGMEVLYRMSDFENYKTYMAEARNYMKNGQLIDNLSEDKKTYTFCTLDSRIEGYKNSYITSVYSKDETIAAKAIQITCDYINFNDCNYSNGKVDKINSVTSQSVLEVFNKYWVNQNAIWFIVK